MEQAATGVNEPEAQAVAIRRRERRFPFEFINTILAVICLASAALAVYKLQRPEERRVEVSALSPWLFLCPSLFPAFRCDF